MIVAQVRFVHYSPKDSEDGIKELVIANDVEQVVNYIDKEYNYDNFKDEKRDGDEGYHSVSSSFWEKHPEKKAEAEKLGLVVGEYDDVEGPSYLISMWLQATTWKSADDAYYGVTHWDWSQRQDISSDDADTLIRLGFAKDIRNEKFEEV